MTTVFEFKRTVIRKSKTAKLLEILDKFRKYEERVETAINEGKVFKFIAAWDVPRLKYELFKRGYIETVANPFYNLRSVLPLYNLVDAAEPFNDFEQALLCKILGDHQPNYIWTEQPWVYQWYSDATIINKLEFGNVNFWLKDGSCHYIRLINSKIKKYKDRIKYPRSYDVVEHKETENFQKDYRFTAATSLVLFLYDRENIENWFCKENGSVYYSSLEFALKAIESRIRRIKHPDDPNNPNYESKKYHHQWKKVFRAHHKVIMEKQKIVCGPDRAGEFIARIHRVTEHLLRYYPNRRHDGYHNIWLLKPTYSGEGRGIIITQNEKEILHHINHNNQSYIIQKYVETPLLIYKTKFDLRQYFMFTVDKEYLRCWWHPVMSVKFASEEFCLEVFNETIHLTNAAIQIKYNKKSNPNLPIEHLWTLGPLVTYIERFLKKGYKWQESVVPAMKKAISQIFFACMHEIDLKPGRYELFGNDWLITDDFETYLLEVNRPPSLVPYQSPVSEIVCSTIATDIIRVSVDFFEDPKASTGQFEIMHEYKISDLKNGRVRPVPCWK